MKRVEDGIVLLLVGLVVLADNEMSEFVEKVVEHEFRLSVLLDNDMSCVRMRHVCTWLSLPVLNSPSLVLAILFQFFKLAFPKDV